MYIFRDVSVCRLRLDWGCVEWASFVCLFAVCLMCVCLSRSSSIWRLSPNHFDDDSRILFICSIHVGNRNEKWWKRRRGWDNFFPFLFQKIRSSNGRRATYHEWFRISFRVRYDAFNDVNNSRFFSINFNPRWTMFAHLFFISFD